MLLPPSRCLSLEEASLGEGRLTHERTEQETKRVRRLFSNHHGVLFYKIIEGVKILVSMESKSL